VKRRPAVLEPWESPRARPESEAMVIEMGTRLWKGRERREVSISMFGGSRYGDGDGDSGPAQPILLLNL